jgi:hypothetical protein
MVGVRIGRPGNRAAFFLRSVDAWDEFAELFTGSNRIVRRSKSAGLGWWRWGWFFFVLFGESGYCFTARIPRATDFYRLKAGL